MLSRWAPTRVCLLNHDDLSTNDFFSSCPIAVTVTALTPSRCHAPRHSTPMPYPRPVSPVTLETCSPPPDADEDEYSLLGSDDDLDEPARAAKRQRIERLAESYLQGQPLFILSASLRGPFDEGWRNPWKKTRRTKRDTELHGVPTGGATETSDHVVQETDPRREKYREDISLASGVAGRSPSKESTDQIAAPADLVSQTNSTLNSRSGQKKLTPRVPRRGSSRASASPLKEQRETSCPENEPTFVGNGATEWLKKDRRRPNFKVFEPPSTPTPKSSRRQSEQKARTIPSRIEKSRHTSGFPSRRSPSKPLAAEQPRLEGDVHQPPESTQSHSQVVEEGPTMSRGSPKRFSPKRGNHMGSSFRVVSSSSQLPRFEYRRPRHEFSPVEQPKSRSPAKPTIANLDGHDSNPPEQDTTEKPNEDPPEPNPEELAQSHHLSKSIRFANETEDSNPPVPSPQAVTEKNTCENLPSAQPVPAPSGLSDRVPSLHSTALPKESHGQEKAASPETQLSTQAALLHAQRSFQDDLETQEHENGTPGLQRPDMDVGNDSLLAHETPLFRPNTLERAPRGYKQSDKDRAQAMSTQCMIDAATPYTFSTEKKPTAFRTIEMEITSAQKPNDADTMEAQESPTRGSPDHGYQTAQSSLRSPAHDPTYSKSHRSTAPAASLPFALSASTPTTAQDGQGGADSFNLSQAIADAGSWLRDSFDFMKEIRPNNRNEGNGPSNTPPSALDFDIPR